MKKTFILLPLVAFALAGCGGNSTGGSTDTSSTSSTGGESGETVYDFSGLTKKGTGLDVTTAQEIFENSALSGSNIVTAVTEVVSVYDGASTGGAYASTAGLIKMGKSTQNGKLVLSLSKSVTKVVVNCSSYQLKTETYPNASENLVINGEAQLLPYFETANKGDLTYNLTSAASTLTIETSNVTASKFGRGFLFTITMSY